MFMCTQKNNVLGVYLLCLLCLLSAVFVFGLPKANSRWMENSARTVRGCSKKFKYISVLNASVKNANIQLDKSLDYMKLYFSQIFHAKIISETKMPYTMFLFRHFDPSL